MKNFYTKIMMILKPESSSVSLVFGLILIAIWILAVGTLVSNSFQSQDHVLARAEANDFYSGLDYYLKQSCDLNFSGKPFPYSTEASPEDSELSIDINGYKTGSYLQKDNILKTGSIIDGRWRIKKLSWKHKNSVPVQAYLFKEQKYKLVIGRIELLSEIIPEAQPAEAFELPLYQFDILFLLNPVTHVVETCQVMFEDEKICESLHAIYDPSTSTCLLNQNCFSKSRANNCIPDPDSDIPNTGNSICHEVLQSHKYIEYNSKDKDGYFASCPSDSTVLFSTTLYGSKKQSCGENCTNTYSVRLKMNNCIVCKSRP